MAFTVEDGTGLENANALIDEQFADDYFDLRGNTEWAGLSSTVKQQKIVLATDYIVRRFYGQIIGSKKNSDQSLPFPRVGEDQVPDGVQKACAEFALLSDELNLSFQEDASGKELISKTVKAGPVTTSKTFSKGSKRTFKKFPIPDSYMKPFLMRTDEVIR